MDKCFNPALLYLCKWNLTHINIFLVEPNKPWIKNYALKVATSTPGISTQKDMGDFLLAPKAIIV